MISMCQDRQCPKRETCDRHAASGREPITCQAWILPDRRGEHCEDYIPTRKEAK
jgi:hypothetical protein